MMLRLFGASLRRRPPQLALVALAVFVAATTWAALAGFSARSRARLAADLRAFGPNLVVRPQVGAPLLPVGEVGRVAGLPAVEVAAGVAELSAAALPALAGSGLRLFVSGPEILRLHPGWELEGHWPRAGEVALGAAAAPRAAAALARPVSGRITTGEALDDAVFLPIEDLPSLGVVGLDRIEARAAPARLTEAARDIEAAVAGAEARPLARVSAGDARLARRILLLLGAIGAVTLALALISVTGATAALLNERRGEMALLAALGYSGRKLAGLVAAELGAAALVAAVAGALGGEWLAGGLGRRFYGAAGPGLTAGGALAAAAAAAAVVAVGVAVTLLRIGRLEVAAVLRGE